MFAEIRPPPLTSPELNSYLVILLMLSTQIKLLSTHLSRSAASKIKEDLVLFLDGSTVSKHFLTYREIMLPSRQSFMLALKWLAKSTASGISVFNIFTSVGVGRMEV